MRAAIVWSLSSSPARLTPCALRHLPITSDMLLCVCKQLVHAGLHPAVQLEQVWALGQLRLLRRLILT